MPRIDQLTHVYPNGTRSLGAVTLDIPRGMFGLLGPNGADKVNAALRSLLDEFAFKPAPYPNSTDLVRRFREVAGPEHQQLITDLFERITLYADGKGKETGPRSMKPSMSECLP